MDYTEVKLIAVWSGPKAPPSQLKLSDYKLPVAGRMPKNYFNALYGNRNAYMALGELLSQAQKAGHYFSTATITVGIETPRKPGVVHLEDLGEESGTQFVNLSRVSKEVVSEVADIYRACSAFKKMPEGEIDWRKPFRFMPECQNICPWCSICCSAQCWFTQWLLPPHPRASTTSLPALIPIGSKFWMLNPTDMK